MQDEQIYYERSGSDDVEVEVVGEAHLIWPGPDWSIRTPPILVTRHRVRVARHPYAPIFSEDDVEFRYDDDAGLKARLIREEIARFDLLFHRYITDPGELERKKIEAALDATAKYYRIGGL